MAKKPLPKEAEKFKFKKGVSGNPQGARLHNPVVRALKKVTLETYCEVIDLVLTNNIAELKALAEDPKTSALQVGIAVAFMKAIKQGDYGVIERIAERIIGKVAENHNFTGNFHSQLVDWVATRNSNKEIDNGKVEKDKNEDGFEDI